MSLGLDQTLTLRNNIIAPKVLAGIANFIKRTSEARFLSRGTQILTTQQEILNTRQAQVLIPLLTPVKDIWQVLAEAKAGGVKSNELQINELLVFLANEKITTPNLYRPRDLTSVKLPQIIQRYAASYPLTATVAKDTAYYRNILSQGKAGVDIAVGAKNPDGKLKAQIVKSIADSADTTAAQIKDNALLFANQIREARDRIIEHKDRFLQSRIADTDLCIIVRAKGRRRLQNDARYNMRTDIVVDKNGAINVKVNGDFDGTPVIVSKHLPDNVEFIVMMFGAATSLFAVRNVMNFDKVPGLQAYLSSMEFDEGTGMWLPHMITIGVRDTNIDAEQEAQGFESYEIDMNLSKTFSGNKDTNAGLPAPLSADSLVKSDKDGDGTLEIDTFDANKWYSSNYAADKANLSAPQITQLKKALGVVDGATDRQIQAALDAEKQKRTE